MKTGTGITRKSILKTICLLSMLALFAACAPAPCHAYLESQRQTGEIAVDEVIMGQSQFVIRVATGGCTSKNSLKVDVKKDEKAIPVHYTLTINRVVPDDCKALFFDGAVIRYDLKEDLGIEGNFTYSITNGVYGSTTTPVMNESFFTSVEKDYPDVFGQKAVAELSSDANTFVMDNDYFSCNLPEDWKLERDKPGDEAAGIYEIILTKTGKAVEEDGEKFFFPDPFIYVGYYTKDNTQGKTYESFIRDYEALYDKRKDSENSRMTPLKSIDFKGSEATEIEYEVFQEVPRGPLFTTEYWLKEKFIIIKAEQGFYVLAYKSPADFYDKYVTDFDKLVESFEL